MTFCGLNYLDLAAFAYIVNYPIYFLLVSLVITYQSQLMNLLLCHAFLFSLLDVWLLGTLPTYHATMENPSYDEECSLYLTWICRSLFKITAKRTTGTIPTFNQWFEEFSAFDSRHDLINFRPFGERRFGSVYLRNFSFIMNDERSHGIWYSFLQCRDLLVFGHYLEPYNPAYVSSHFGFEQLVPLPPVNTINFFLAWERKFEEIWNRLFS